MTEDHVPPKCCKNKGEISYYRIFETMMRDEHNKVRTKPWNVQNGIKYKTICSTCNNEILGGNYDPALENFVQVLDDKLVQGIDIYNKCVIEIELNKVTRAIVGHMLAGINYYIENGQIEVKLREYFKDTSMKRIDGLELYFWIYPYNDIMFERNFGIMGKSVLNNTICNILKFPPVAFLLTDKKVDIDAINLFSLTNNNISDLVELSFCPNDMNNMIRLKSDWPNTVTDDYLFVKSPEVLKDSFKTLPLK